MFGAKELLGAINGQLLNLINKFTAAVVAAAGVALGVFVGQNRAHGRENGRADIVLRGNQFDASSLPRAFLFDSSIDDWIGSGQGMARVCKFNPGRQAG